MERSVELLAAASRFVGVQVPHDGQPRGLMADRQTTGGYTKIAHIATVDLPILAKCMPGDSIKFAQIDLEQAQQLDTRREDTFEQLYQALTPLRELLANG